MVGLTIFVCEGSYQVRAFARENQGYAFINRYRHDGGPARVDAESDSGGLHDMQDLRPLDGQGYGIPPTQAQRGDPALPIAAL